MTREQAIKYKASWHAASRESVNLMRAKSYEDRWAEFSLLEDMCSFMGKWPEPKDPSIPRERWRRLHEIWKARG